MSEGRAFCFDNLDELQDAYIQLEKVLLEEREDYEKLKEENRQLKAKLLEMLEELVGTVPDEYRGLCQPSVDLVKKEFGL